MNVRYVIFDEKKILVVSVGKRTASPPPVRPLS